MYMVTTIFHDHSQSYYSHTYCCLTCRLHMSSINHAAFLIKCVCIFASDLKRHCWPSWGTEKMEFLYQPSANDIIKLVKDKQTIFKPLCVYSTVREKHCCKRGKTHFMATDIPFICRIFFSSYIFSTFIIFGAIWGSVVNLKLICKSLYLSLIDTAGDLCCYTVEQHEKYNSFAPIA